MCAVLSTALFFVTCFNALAQSNLVEIVYGGGAVPPSGWYHVLALNEVRETIDSDLLVNNQMGSFRMNDIIGDDFGDFGLSYPLINGPIFGADESDIVEVYSVISKMFTFDSDFLTKYDGAKIVSISVCGLVGFVDTIPDELDISISLDGLLSFNYPGYKEFYEPYRILSFPVSLDGQLAYRDFNCSVIARKYDFSDTDLFVGQPIPFVDGGYPNRVEVCLDAYIYGNYPVLDVVSVIPRVIIELVLPENLEEYEQNVVIENNQNTLDKIQGDVSGVLESVQVDFPSDSVISNVVDDIDVDKIQSFTEIGGINNLSNDSNLFSLITLICVSTLGVAFIGYVLHGKRG